MKLVDIFVILDSVQFPRGASWVNRNRIKTPNGQLWLTVPVKKHSLGLQKIKDVKIDNEHNWRKKHCLSLKHYYSKAPYFEDYIGFFEQIYKSDWAQLVDLNVTMIKEIAKWLEIKTKFVLSSTLGVTGTKSELLIDICKQLSADTYLSGSGGKKYLEPEKFSQRGIKIKYYSFNPSPYPQLWGDFISNLSIIDLFFNCGKKGFDFQSKYVHLSSV
ncbi:WbqC family protein [candidate division WOR-3 bacterium]|nr:WbqC family protein [candidate division WOR-3 bacterium]